MSVNWKKVVFDIFKYALGAVLGAIGISASGCVCFPQFIF